MNLQSLLERLSAFLDGSHVPKASLEAAINERDDAQVRHATLKSSLESIMSELTAARETGTAQGVEITSLRQQLSTATALATTSKSEAERLQAIITDPKGEIANRVSAILSGASVPAAITQTMSASVTADPQGQLKVLREQMKAETDPAKRGELARKCREVRGDAAQFAPEPERPVKK